MGNWGNFMARGEDQHTCKSLSWVDADIPILELNQILGNAAGKGKECRHPYFFSPDEICNAPAQLDLTGLLFFCNTFCAYFIKPVL